MKKTLLALSLTIISATSIANENKKYTFLASDDTNETKICIIAAKDGMKKAKEFSREVGINFNKFKDNTYCNGQRLSKFVKTYNKIEKKEENKTKKILVAADNSVESEICVKAVSNGVESLKEKYNGNVSKITCNGKKIATFVNKYKNY